MTEPIPPPEGGRLVPIDVLNWYEVVEARNDISLIDTVFANPVTTTVISIENPTADYYVVNQLVYDEWGDVVRELHEEEEWSVVREYANNFMRHHTTKEPTERQQILGELFG